MNLESLYTCTMDVRVPLGCTFLYLIYSIKTNKSLKNVSPTPRAYFSLLTFVMILHNIILCLFSFTTFIKTFPEIYKFFKGNTLINFMQDPNGILKEKIQFWIWIFYVSKIYEIVDSLILHWNKRPTSFLQMYHHAGAIICCWLLAKAQSHLPWIFVVLNSFIHSLMYFYYLLVTMRVKVPMNFKRLITRMQIVQFVSGLFLMISHVFVGKIFSQDPELRKIQYLAVSLNLIYVAVLFCLFRAFEKKTYQKKAVKTE